MIDHALVGKRLDLIGGADLPDNQPPMCREAMQEWCPKRTIRAEVLRQLLLAKQWPVHAKGVRLRGVKITGLLDLELAKLRCPLVLEDCFFESEDAVVFDYATVSLLKLVRCRLAGLRACTLVATKELDLTRSSFTGPVDLFLARVRGRLAFSGVEITESDEDGFAITADGVKVGGDVALDDDFSAGGAISLTGAVIRDSLNCSGARITKAECERGDALCAVAVKVGRNVFLDEGFTADGAVRLSGANITRDLKCRGAKLQGKDKVHQAALLADGVKIGGDLLLDLDRDAAASPDNVSDPNFTAAGAVRLMGADVKGKLSCTGAQITKTDNEGSALVADRITVGGDVLLDEGFTAVGDVRLVGVHVGGLLSLHDATLGNKKALNAEGAIINHELHWAPKTEVTGVVNLQRARVHRLDDDWTQTVVVPKGNGIQLVRESAAYWPSAANLKLTGFVYDGFGGKAKASWQQRLEWVRSQYEKPESGQPGNFEAQPYEQLARVYRATGDDKWAREIAIAQRRDRRTYVSLKLPQRFGDWVSQKTTAYGYKSLRAVWVVLVVLVLAVAGSWSAQHLGVVVPAKDTRHLYPTPTATKCTSAYPCFYPVGYAIDLTIPIVTVGQSESWRLNGDADWGWVWVDGSWVLTGLGWAFTTLAVAGYTGIIRKD